jgi:hypothetical protein
MGHQIGLVNLDGEDTWWCFDEDVNANECSDENRCSHQCCCNPEEIKYTLVVRHYPTRESKEEVTDFLELAVSELGSKSSIEFLSVEEQSEG